MLWRQNKRENTYVIASVSRVVKVEHEFEKASRQWWTKHWNMPMGSNIDPLDHLVEACRLAKNDLQHPSDQIRVLHLQFHGQRLGARSRDQRLQLPRLSSSVLHQLHQLHHHRHHLLPGWTAHLLMDRLRLHRGGERHGVGDPPPVQGPQVPNEFLYQAFGRSWPMCGSNSSANRHHLAHHHLLEGRPRPLQTRQIHAVRRYLLVYLRPRRPQHGSLWCHHPPHEL